MKKVALLLLIVLTFYCTSNAQVQETHLDSIIHKALQVSPAIKMLSAKLEVVKNKVPQVSNLPDPMLTLGLMNLPVNSFSFNQEPMTGKVVGLSQNFPFPGKLGTMEDVSAKDIEIVQQEINDKKNEIKKNVKKNYYELIFLRKAIDISESTKNLLKNILEVVKTKYSVSSASQQNLIKVELEITNVNDRLEKLRGKEKARIAILNSYLLAPASSPIKTEHYGQIKYLTLTQPELDSIAQNNRPFLKGINSAAEKAALMVKAVKYDFYPNFNLSLKYSFRDYIKKTNTPLNDFFSVAVGISLPLNYGGKVTAKVDEAAAMQQLYSEQYAASLQMLNINFGSAAAKINSIEERIKLIIEGLLPQAEQNLSTALSSYQVGEIDFINVIDAQNKLYQIKTNLYRLETDYLKEISELEFLAGKNLMN